MSKVASTILGAAINAIGTLIVTGNPFMAAAVFVGSIALGVISQVTAPDIDRPSNRKPNLKDLTRTIRASDAPWRILVGYKRIGGVLTYYEATNNNKTHHLVITLVGHEVHKIGTVYFNGEPIYDEQIDSAGIVRSGPYYPITRILKHTGSAGQQVDTVLRDNTQVGNDFRGRGIAYLYVQITWDRDKLPNGLPDISADVYGAKVEDVRQDNIFTFSDGTNFADDTYWIDSVGGSSTSPVTKWTLNPALLTRWWMLRSVNNLGLEATIDEVDNNLVIDAANVCDEFVDTAPLAVTISGVNTTLNVLNVEEKLIPFTWGDRVQVSSSGSLPGGISAETDYYVIPRFRMKNTVYKAGFGLAVSYDNALSEQAIDITSAGTGNITVTKNGEPRYTASGIIESGQSSGEILEEFMLSMAGNVVNSGGQWKMYPGTWRTPTMELTEDDLIGAINVQTRVSRRDRFNEVGGKISSPLFSDQPSDYPPVKNAMYREQDGGFPVRKTLDFDFVFRPSTAQRIAKIILEKNRQAIRINAPFSLSAMRVSAGQNIYFTRPRYGWNLKQFEVQTWALVSVGTSEEPSVGIEMTLVETAPGVYDWNSGEETRVDLSPNTELPSGLVVAAPGVPVINEIAYITRDGAGVKVLAEITWAASPDGFADDYQVEARLIKDADGNVLDNEFRVIGRTNATIIEYRDIQPGTWEFRVKAFNILGVSSAYSTKTYEVTALSAPPVELQNVSIAAIGGFALIRWDLSPELDVRVGGQILVRYSASIVAASWNSSISITKNIPGSATEAVVPLLPGSYLLRARDSSGNVGPITVLTTKGVQVLAFAPVDTLQEDPLFAGTNNNTVVDTVNDVLKLASVGGVVVSEGYYTFAAGFDFLTVKAVRIRIEVECAVSNEQDLIDGRSALIDTWPDFDSVDGDEADAEVQMRMTDGDPSGSPTWTAWERVHSAEIEARGVQFRIKLMSDDSAFNILVSHLRVHADEVA